MKQSERSKHWMEDALLQLMEQKNYSKITVKDITEKAGVSRLTFYRNFESKEDILKFHFECIFQNYENTLKKNIFSIREGVRQCFTYWKNLSKEILLLKKNNLTGVMFAPFDEYARRVLALGNQEDYYSDIQITFVIGGLFQTMLRLSSAEDWSVDEVTNAIMELIPENKPK